MSGNEGSPGQVFDPELMIYFGETARLLHSASKESKLLSDFPECGCYRWMKERSDRDLLEEYVEEESDSAFAAIVARYTDLVYSAACRQVGAPDLARDVVQNVFSDLGRKARRLKLTENGSLVGWLYRATRYAALTLMRSERRRQARERLAMEQLSPCETSSDWSAIGPILDEAMAALSEADREVLLLRFFKNQDLRTVGAALGVSDDAAQKRVARGLEKLRVLLAGRGMSTSSTTLSVVISANAVQAAPPGFAATVAASASAASGSTPGILEIMAMTKSQMAVAGAVIIASVVSPLVLQQQAQATLREKDATLQQQSMRLIELTSGNERLSKMIGNLSASPRPDNGELLRLRGEVARLRQDVQELTQRETAPTTNRADKLAALAAHYSGRIAELQQFLATNPSESVPEIQFLTERNWLWLVGENTPNTAEGYQLVASLARQMAQENLAHTFLQPALKQYTEANSGQFPADIAALKPYFTSSVDDAILERWQVIDAKRLTNLSQNLRNEGWVITQKAPVNRAIDQRLTISLKDFHSFADGAPAQWDVAP
jgi:RNA polymerase sigma factor (sigma-70 family)